MVSDRKWAYCGWYFQNTIDKLCINLTKIVSNIEYLIPRIFNNTKKEKWAWSKLVLNRKWA